MADPPDRTRLRFTDFECSELPSGRCRSRVVLSWEPGEEFVGTSEGLSSPTGRLRCSAEAALEALGGAVEARNLRLELLGVKAVRAFDAVVVIVSLSSKDGGQATRLIGSCLTHGDPARGAALAVLNATNRLLGNVLLAK